MDQECRVTGIGQRRVVGRRAACALLAAAALPRPSRAQEAPIVPQTPPPPPPTVTSPVAPAPPAGPPPRAASTPAIDKTKLYYVFFDQNIDVASMRTLRRQITVLVEAGVAEITLVMDSPGGLIEPMLLTYSFLRALPITINTHAQGFVQSAATVLFLAGQGRSSDRNTRFLFHPSQASTAGYATDQQIRDRLAQIENVAGAVAQIYRDRTSFTDEDIQRFEREQVIYTADQALAHGIVQTVGDLRIPGDQKARMLFIE